VKEPLWIDVEDALALHDHLIALHGGAAGLRDKSSLQSALARPRQRYAYASAPDIAALAAAYTAGIIGNHPFIDGNKRTGFVTGVLFLEINGHRFVASEEDATDAVLNLAAGAIKEKAFAAWLRANVKRPGNKPR